MYFELCNRQTTQDLPSLCWVSVYIFAPWERRDIHTSLVDTGTNDPPSRIIVGTSSWARGNLAENRTADCRTFTRPKGNYAISLTCTEVVNFIRSAVTSWINHFENSSPWQCNTIFLSNHHQRKTFLGWCWHANIHRYTCVTYVDTIQPLKWRHKERDGVSNHQPHACLLNRLFRHRSKKTSKLRVTGLCEVNSPVTGEFSAQRASNAEDVSIGWRHHDMCDPGRAK